MSLHKKPFVNKCYARPIWVVLADPHPEVNFVVTFMGDRLHDVRNGDSREVPMVLAFYFRCV